jgi:uncharacterized protein (UPF0335 family)
MKALKFEEREQEVNEPRKIPNAGAVKEFVNRAMKLEEQLDQAKADLKGLYDDAHDQGFDRKALKIVIKNRKKPMSFELRQEVNELQTKLGDLPLFAAIAQ